MKKIYSLLSITIILSFTQNFYSQENSDAQVIHCESFHISKTLMEINAENPVNLRKIEREHAKKVKESKDKKFRTPQNFIYSVEKDGDSYGNDNVLIQKSDGSRNPDSKAPIQNWLGQNAAGFRPYDPSGAAGPNHYIQAINSTTYKIYNKNTGAVVTSGSVGNLWSPATPNNGDPIVMYDRHADRWFISQFGSSGNKIYIAISTTNDPTGSYYTYTFSSPQFPDYLKFAIWADGYYMTSNQGSQKVFAFERDEMLIGNPTARAISKTFSPPTGGGFFCPLAGDADGNTGLPPYGTPCPIFSYSDNAWGGGAIDGVQIYQMAVNWLPVTPTATITFTSAIPTAAFDASYNSSWNDISQPGISQKLDGIGGVLNYRAQWRKWAGYNSVVLTWGVKISPSQRSVMWCEMRQDQGTSAWSVYQQGVFTPDAYNRWLGSIAMDDLGNIGLSYAVSGSSTMYPSLGYTGRLASDPINTMTFSETIAINGTVSQSGGNRFGDYSHTTLDPDGITFWHTGEYCGGTASSSAARTRIYSYRLQTANVPTTSITSDDIDNTICNGESVTFTATSTLEGTTPTYQWIVNGVNVGTNSPIYTTTSLTNNATISCIMTSNDPSAIGGPAYSNSITFSVGNIVTPSVNILGNPNVCSGQTINLAASSSNSGSTPSYQWQVNGINAGTNSSNFSYIPVNGDNVTCTLTSSALCTTTPTANSSPVTIIVNSSPAIPTITENGGILTSSSGAGNQWYLNGNLISGASGQNYTYTSGGNYTVVVTVTGCSSTSAVHQIASGAGIEELDPYLLTIYPNPSQGEFNISFESKADEKYSIKIFDAVGKIVYSNKVENQNGISNLEIKLSNISSGAYTITLTNGSIETNRKIVIKK